MSEPPGRWGIWLSAARPRTLPAAVAPVLVGSSLAWSDGDFHLLAALACLAFALLVQIGTNFANDYYDFIKGADTAERVGPQRAVAAGLVAPATMRATMLAVFAIAFIVGLSLIGYGGWPLLTIGVTSIVCGIAYTGGPYPLGYNGLGDVFVFIFFGLVAVGATYFVQAGSVSAASLIAACGVGALATNILVVNNYRDVETDAKAGKRTLVVRFGRRFARVQFAAAHAVAVLTVIALALREVISGPAAVVVGVGAMVAGALQARRLATAATPAACIALLGTTGGYLALYAVALSVAVVLG